MSKSFTFITRWFERILGFINENTLLSYLIKIKPNWYGKYDIVDKYVLIVLAFDWLIFASAFVCPINVNTLLSIDNCFVKFISIIVFFFFNLFLVWRLLEILSSWVNHHLLTRKVKSPFRSLVLAFFNFADITVIYAILDFWHRNSFKNSMIELFTKETISFSKASEALHFSLSTIVTMGSPFEPITIWGFILQYSEIFFGILFIAVIITSIISYMQN